MTRADGEHDVFTVCKSKIFAFVTRPRRPSVTILSCVWCMNIVYGSVPQFLLFVIVSSVVSCVHSVCVSISAVSITCVEGSTMHVLLC